MRKNLLIFFTCLIGISLFAACAPHNSIQKSYQAEEAEAQAFSHVLIAGMHSNPRLRARFELALLDQLVLTGEESGRYSLLSETEPGQKKHPDRALLAQAAEQSASDAVLVTRIINKNRTVHSTIKQDEILLERKEDGPLHMFRYDYKLSVEADEMSLSTDIVMLIELYRTEDKARLWSLKSSVYDGSSFEELLDQESRQIAEKISRDKLINWQ